MTTATVAGQSAVSFASVRCRLLLLDEFDRLRTAFEKGNAMTRATLVRELAALARELQLLEQHYPTGITLDAAGAIAGLAAASESFLAGMSHLEQAGNVTTVAGLVSAARHWRATHRGDGR
jgi:hypothetical protein